MSKLFEGAVCPITITLDHDAEGIVVHLVEKTKRNILAKWSYPARSDYSTLSVDGRIYTGVLTASETINKSNEPLVLEVKEFINDNFEPIGVADVVDSDGNIVKLADNTVKNVSNG
jgi:hypothetical protein